MNSEKAHLSFCTVYSQLSANGLSRKQTALLTDTFFNSLVYLAVNFCITHSRERTLSRKRTRTLLKIKIEFFFCSRSLTPTYNNCLFNLQFKQNYDFFVKSP